MDSLLRHSLATLAYRLGKVLRDAPLEFADYQAGPGARTPLQILAHIGDLLDWALTMVKDQPAWHDSQPFTWPQEVERFFRATHALDAGIVGGDLKSGQAESLFQGPIADALTHTGQLAMLRRVAGCKMIGENYFMAEIVAGRLGPDQAPPRREF